MKYRMILAAAFAAVATTPASAGDRLRLAQAMQQVPPYEVLTIVRSARLDPIGVPLRRGPTYVLRAIDDDDREVRVVVDARYGDILSITPAMTASRDLPPRELPPRRYGRPYDRPDGYGPDYRSAPPIVYETDPPLDRPRGNIPNSSLYGPDALTPPTRGAEPPRVIYSDRPAGAPNDPAYGRRMASPPRDAGPPPVIAATPPDGIERRQPSSPQSIAPSGTQAGIDIRIDPTPREDGVLPPPPERFPQRAPPPAAKPAPPKRAVAAPPKQAPLPKPRPADAAKVEAAPVSSAGGESPPAPAASEKKSAIDQMPH